MYLARGFFDADLCLAVRAAMDRGVGDAAEVIADEIAEQTEVRRTESIEVDEATLAAVEHRLDGQRQAIEAFFDLPLVGREGAGFLRYQPGGFYLPHVDYATDGPWPEAARRAITVVVFLNDDFIGGVLRIGGVDVLPVAGTLVAFPADVVHEVTPVRGGLRDTVVDWFLD